MVEIFNKTPFGIIGYNGFQFRYNKKGLDITAIVYLDPIPDGPIQTFIGICRTPYNRSIIDGRPSPFNGIRIEEIKDFETKEANDIITKTISTLEPELFTYWGVNDN